MNEDEVLEENKTVDIFPTKISRRILTFLGDFFMCFIASIFLFEIVIRPISFSIIKFQKLAADSDNAIVNNLKILYDNEFLYYTQVTNGNLTESIKYSCDLFTKDFCFDIDDKEHDIFYNYLVEYKKEDISKYLEIFKFNDYKYFEVNEDTKTVRLKEEYVNLFKPKFEDKNEISEVGKEKYDLYCEEFFLNAYTSKILTDVKANDLSSIAHPEYGTFLENEKISENYENHLKDALRIDAYISFGITMIIFYFIIPLCNKKGQTCTEMIMKIESIDIKYISYLKKRFILSKGLFNVVSNSAMLVFIPVITMGIVPIFALTDLLSVSIIGFIFTLIQLGLLFTKMNQTLKEFSTNSICVDSSTMDEYFKVKGYDF